MTNNQFLITFIDDCFDNRTELHSERIDLIDSVEKSLEGIAEIKRLTPGEVFKDEQGFIRSSDLIVMDYKFDNADPNDESPAHVGNELVSIVRCKAIDKPIYMLSVEVDERLENTGDDVYERYISQEQLSDEGFILNEINGFQILRDTVKSQNIKSILQVFGCPDDQVFDFERSLPDRTLKELSGYIDDDIDIKTNGVASVVTLYRWFINEFILYPGLLYSDEYCAVLMGVKVEYFRENIAQRLDECLYEGPFNESFPPRWWAASIQNWLVEKDEEFQLTGINDQEAITKILDVDESFYSICEVCEEKFPETYGHDIDVKKKEFLPVHIKCSQPPIGSAAASCFLKPRVIKGK